MGTGIFSTTRKAIMGSRFDCLQFSSASITNLSMKRRYAKLGILCIAFVTLSACSLGKAFMAGYTPPQTIADLLNQQYQLAGESPVELDVKARSNNAISKDNYPGETPAANEPSEYVDSIEYQAPIQRFRPRFTYKSVQDYAGQLAMELIKNANGLSHQAAIGVTSFVKLDYSLQNTTVLGNQMAEYSISEIQQFGLNVIDFKLMPAIQVTQNGDLAFSRDLMKLANNNIMDHVLAATMIEKADGVFINARIIALNSNRVVSSASVLIPNFVVQKAQPQFANYGAD